MAEASALTRLTATMLFNISPTDLASLEIVSMTLVGAALIACYFPARRATRLDPVVALRAE